MTVVDGQYRIKLVCGALSIGIFFGGIGGGVAFPTLPALGSLLGFSPLFVGMILSVNRFTRLIMNVPVGYVFDRIGSRRPILIGFGFQALAPFGYVLGLQESHLPIGSFSVFMLARISWGIGSALVITGAFSTITHITTQNNRGRWIGYMRGAQSIGFPSGLIIGGIVTDVFGYTEAFLSAGVAGLIAVGIGYLLIPKLKTNVKKKGSIRDIPQLVHNDQRIISVGVVNAIVRLLFSGILLSTIVLYARYYGITISSLSGVGVSGIVMAVSVLGSGVATVLVGNFSDSFSTRTRLVIPALFILGCGFSVLGILTNLLSTIIGVALIGIGVGATTPTLLAFLGDISPDDDVGKVGGFFNAFGDLGSTVGPLIAVPMVTSFGYKITYIFCTILVLFSALIILYDL